MKQPSQDRPKKNHRETRGTAMNSALPLPTELVGRQSFSQGQGWGLLFQYRMCLCWATHYHIPSPQIRGFEADAGDGKGKACDSGAGRGGWPAGRWDVWVCLILFLLGSTKAVTCWTRLSMLPTPRDQRKSFQQESSQRLTTSMLLFLQISNRNLSL